MNEASDAEMDIIASPECGRATPMLAWLESAPRHVRSRESYCVWLQGLVEVRARGRPNRIRIALYLVSLLAWNGRAYCASLGVLVPVRQGDEIASKPGVGGAAVPVLQPAPDSMLRRALIKEST